MVDIVRRRIRVIGTPPGEAPREIREKWIGIVLPLAPGFDDVFAMEGVGVLSGATHEPKREMVIGYLVLFQDALCALDAKDSEAAKWWRTNAFHLDKEGECLLFDQDVCELLDS